MESIKINKSRYFEIEINNEFELLNHEDITRLITSILLISNSYISLKYLWKNIPHKIGIHQILIIKFIFRDLRPEEWLTGVESPDSDGSCGLMLSAEDSQGGLTMGLVTDDCTKEHDFICQIPSQW